MFKTLLFVALLSCFYAVGFSQQEINFAYWDDENEVLDIVDQYVDEKGGEFSNEDGLNGEANEAIFEFGEDEVWVDWTAQNNTKGGLTIIVENVTSNSARARSIALGVISGVQSNPDAILNNTAAELNGTNNTVPANTTQNAAGAAAAAASAATLANQTNNTGVATAAGTNITATAQPANNSTVEPAAVNGTADNSTAIPVAAANNATTVASGAANNATTVASGAANNATTAASGAANNATTAASSAANNATIAASSAANNATAAVAAANNATAAAAAANQTVANNTRLL